MIYLEASNASYISQNEPTQQLLRSRSYTSRDPGYYVVLAEFSEVYGPMPIKTIPDDNTSEDINDFIVQIMSIDYTGTHAGVPTYSPQDTSLIYQHTKSKISAFVHFFNLHDVHARGYSRIFTLSFITRSSRVLFTNIASIRSCFESISHTCHVENRIKFHSEMIDKRNQFKDNLSETKQVNWWLDEMRKRYNLQMTSCEEAPVTAATSVSQEDLESSRNQVAESGMVRLRRTRSLIQDLNSVSKYASQNIKRPGEHKLRGLRDLVPFSYQFLERSLKQLHRSRGSVGRIKRLKPDKTPSLSLGGFVLQLPSPSITYEDTNNHQSHFASQDEGSKPGGSIFYMELGEEGRKSEEWLTRIGLSSFYSPHLDTHDNHQYLDDRRSLESSDHSFDMLYGLRDCNLDEHDPQFIKPFSETVHPYDHSNRVPNVSNGLRRHSSSLNFTSAGQISCINPGAIETDLMRFKRILIASYKDCVFSVLSGRPIVIVGDLELDIMASFKNALSLFVTAPNRIDPKTKHNLTLEDLSRYTLLQCRRSALSEIERFAKMGLCSVISPDRRCGKAPRYTGQLISRIWGGGNPRPSTVRNQVNESVLFSIVQSGLVSELGSAVIDKYYSMLLHENCSIESVLGSTPEDQCDNLILQFQSLLLLHPAHRLLMTSHCPNIEFKYENNATFNVRFTS